MWRSDDGTLPNHDTQLARSDGLVDDIGRGCGLESNHLFDIDGDRVTNSDLQAELGKANALIVTKRTVGPSVA